MSQGEEDGVDPPEAAEAVPAKFTGPFAIVTLPGVGHFPQRQAPDALVPHLLVLLTGEGS